MITTVNFKNDKIIKVMIFVIMIARWTYIYDEDDGVDDDGDDEWYDDFDGSSPCPSSPS